MANPFALGGPAFGIGGFLLNLIGSLRSEQMNMEDREDWRQRTNEGLGKIEDITQQGQGFRQDLNKQLLPAFQNLSNMWSRGAANIADIGIRDWNNLSGQVTGDYRGAMNNIQGLSGERMSALNRGISGLQSGMDQAYGNRLGTGMSMLEGLGAQAKKDIRQDYADRTQSELARLGSVGLGNTSAGAVTQRGMAESQANDMNRLNESLRREQFNAYSGLSGDQLASRSQLGQFGLSMSDAARAQDLGMRERMQNVYSNLSSGIGKDRLNAQQGLREFSLSNRVASGQSMLDTFRGLAMEPQTFKEGMVREWNALAQDWGLPPEVIPWQLPAGQGLTNAWDVRQTRKGQEAASSGGGFNTPLFGMSW